LKSLSSCDEKGVGFEEIFGAPYLGRSRKFIVVVRINFKELKLDRKKERIFEKLEERAMWAE